MNIAVVSIGSFDSQYSDYHIMKDIILGFLDKGHNVYLYQKGYLDKQIFPIEFDKYIDKSLKVFSFKFEKKAKADLKARYFADLNYYKKICKVLKKNRPDKIFLQSNNTSFYTVYYTKHFLHCPIVYNEQDLFPENALFANIINKNSLLYKIAHILQRYTYKNVTAISTISSDIKDTICNMYDIDSSKIEVIHNWGHEEVKAHDDSDNLFLKKYPKKDREFRVLYAGNIGTMQNIELILGSAILLKEDKDIKFYIVGDGVYKEKLINKANKNKLDNVIFIPMQDEEVIADLYKSADLNLIPLIKGLIYAALPSKMADCLIANKPILTCVDQDSKFVSDNKKYGIFNVPYNAPDKLKEEILNIKDGHYKGDNKALLKDFYDKNKNVSLHYELIEKLGN